MTNLRDPNTLTANEIENIEKQSLRCLYQATVDFGFETAGIFRQSIDEVKDVAEDVTREILDRLSGYQIQQRIFGNVDYRKARYVIFPDLCIRQALFVDSKAEKENRTATLQMSQISMAVRQHRGVMAIDEAGKLPAISVYQHLNYLTTTLLAHYHYRDDAKGRHILDAVTLAATPNRRLQDRYNPTAEDTIWLVGRNAPTLGEDFRVRLSFERLLTKTRWRVQNVRYDHTTSTIMSEWLE